jgi:uncharacterized damage-inducible protein DinB
MYRLGGVGAMMDELERASKELIRILEPVEESAYKEICDSKTSDENCRSIQTIMSHVVSAGYSYANYIRKAFSEDLVPYTKVQLQRDQALTRMREMLDYTVATLEGKWTLPDEDLQKVVIHSNWGTQYDLEQLLEHAIVHILRHRRQIERFCNQKA